MNLKTQSGGGGEQRHEEQRQMDGQADTQTGTEMPCCHRSFERRIAKCSFNPSTLKEEASIIHTSISLLLPCSIHTYMLTASPHQTLTWGAGGRGGDLTLVVMTT